MIKGLLFNQSVASSNLNFLNIDLVGYVTEEVVNQFQLICW